MQCTWYNAYYPINNYETEINNFGKKYHINRKYIQDLIITLLIFQAIISIILLNESMLNMFNFVFVTTSSSLSLETLMHTQMSPNLQFKLALQGWGKEIKFSFFEKIVTLNAFYNIKNHLSNGLAVLVGIGQTEFHNCMFDMLNKGCN